MEESEKKWVTEELTVFQLHRRIQRLEEICEILLHDASLREKENHVQTFQTNK
jgi:hypothetical protein